MVVAPATGDSSDLEDLSLPFVLDRRRRRREDGEDSKHVLAHVRESMPHARRNQDAVARGEVGPLFPGKEPGLSLDEGYHLFDPLVAVARSSRPGGTDLFQDAQLLRAGRRSGMEPRQDAGSPFDEVPIPQRRVLHDPGLEEYARRASGGPSAPD
jgi:hypothetical protein